jgi:hypothetical protein
MDISEDTESKKELLRELDNTGLSWEESRETTRTRSKRVLAWGKVQRTAKRTQIEMRASHERSSEEPKYFSFPSEGEQAILEGQETRP